MYARHDNRDSLDGAASPRSSASVGREMEVISGRKFQSGVCLFGSLIERYLGAGEGLGVGGGGITNLSIKVSSHLTRRHSEKRASAHRTKRRLLQ